MKQLIAGAPAVRWDEIAARATLGVHHEQQHQELLLTDIKHCSRLNPLRPAYRERHVEYPAAVGATPFAWQDRPAGVYEIGYEGARFAFDNEGPRHRVDPNAFRIAGRPVTNAEYLEFMEDGGYHNPALWLSQGWQTVRERGWQAPLYWESDEGGWLDDDARGMRPVEACEPVCHVSYFEADAYARWAGKRLPSEAEWEVVAGDEAVDGNFSTAAASIRRPLPPPPPPRNSSATSGNGRRARIRPTRATDPPPARSVNTTESSCAGSTCCAAARARHRQGTCARPTATSSTRPTAGSFRGYALPDDSD